MSAIRKEIPPIRAFLFSRFETRHRKRRENEESEEYRNCFQRGDVRKSEERYGGDSSPHGGKRYDGGGKERRKRVKRERVQRLFS